VLRKYALIVVLALVCCKAQAAKVDINFELPRLATANYHKPYVAIWMEGDSSKETLLLWHLKRAEKDKWLKDIRRWWRKLGRYGKTPDGVTGATRGPGSYSESFEIKDDSPFTLFIEVVREDGGRSLLRQRIDMNADIKQYALEADDEIGQVTITIGG